MISRYKGWSEGKLEGSSSAARKHVNELPTPCGIQNPQLDYADSSLSCRDPFKFPLDHDHDASRENTNSGNFPANKRSDPANPTIPN